jgi:hypothetical protein
MSTTINRKKSVIAIVLALALGAILLLLSASAAHAGPGDAGDGPGNDNPTAIALPPQVQASENPVVFQGLQTTKQITVTWEPYKLAAVRLIDCTKPGGFLVFQPDDPPLAALTVTYGQTGKVCLETFPERGKPTLVGPALTITTVRVDVTSVPQQPEINPTLIPIRPNLPHPPLAGSR